MRQQAECLGVTLSVGLATNVCQKAFMVNVNNLAAVLSRKPASTNHAVKMTRVKCDAMAFDFVYMEVIIFLCMQDISCNCEWSTLWKLCV